jgi:outer membrane protein OmpA-like peptidoglycan-associated protein
MDRLTISVLAGCISLSASQQAVAQNDAIASSDVLSQISMFSYREGPKSDLNFRGTPIAANAFGYAEVEYEEGNARISAEVEELPAPSELGPYTTYVLWALSPDGRAANQGVIAGYEGGDGEIETEYGASQFALIVTAEPHFAVSAPSTMIALYNVAEDVEGTESKVTTLTERSDYSKLNRIATDDKKKSEPIELVQAQYAVAIADSVGAKQYAPEQYKAAESKLGAAQLAATAKKNSEQKMTPDLAREAVIAGEDARRAAMIGAAEAEAERERQATAVAATEAQRARSAAEAEAQRARSASENAARARNELYSRLQAALPTTETERGLVSEVGGVQFATGTSNLSAAAREGLARFAGIVASYPGLRFTVEGHTDNTGSIATNNELSLRRAIAVRDYLIGQNVAASSIDVEGLGPSRPIADNASAEGRTRNRRVEIIVSGGPLDAGSVATR